MPNAIPAENSLPLLPTYCSSGDKANRSLINQRLNSASLTNEVPGERNTIWSPRSVTHWLKSIFRGNEPANGQEHQSILEHGRDIRHMAEGIAASQAQKNDELQRPVSCWAGCVLATIATITASGAVIWYGLRTGSQGATRNQDMQSAGNESMALPPPDSLPDYQQAASHYNTWKKNAQVRNDKNRCHYKSKWTQHETIGLCPSDRKHPVVAPKPKRCWHHSTWTNRETPYYCDDAKKVPHSRHKTVATVDDPQSPCSRIKSDSLQPKLESVPCSKDKVDYQYPASQNEICLEQAFLERCELAHKEASVPLGRLILPVDKKACFCPPPLARRENYDIVPFQADNDPAKGRVVPNDGARVPGNFESITVHTGKGTGLVNWLYNVAKKALSSTAVLEPDEVKKVLRFDFKCVEAREHLTLAEWSRAIGKALNTPITSMALESQIVHYHVTLGEGCPTAEQVDFLKKITMPMDILASLFLQILPGAKPYAVLQNIVGPLLQQWSNYLEDKPMDMNGFMNVQQQLHFMMKELIPTLSASETSKLYTESKEKPETQLNIKPNIATEEDIVTKRYALHDGKPYVQISGKYYPLQSKPDGTPFVTESDDVSHVIVYDHAQESWNFADEPYDWIYSEGHLDNIEEYTIPIKVVDDNHIIATSDDDSATILIPDKPAITGVFINGAFIPTRRYHINSSMVTATNTMNKEEQRILIHGDAGWFFEHASTTIDKYLKILLNTRKTKGIKFTKEREFAPIDDTDGLCQNNFKDFFIKHEYKYYKVKVIYGISSKDISYNIEGFDNARVKYENGLLKLKNDKNMLFSLQTEEITDTQYDNSKFRIEAEIRHYLAQYGKRTNSYPTNWIGSGLYLDVNGRKMFIIGNDRYEVRNNSPTEIFIKGNELNRDKDIVLWSDHGTYTREREESGEPGTEYVANAACRVARSPGDAASCLHVKVERGINELLLSHITTKTTNNDGPPFGRMDEVNIYDLHFIYQDRQTQKYYFRYNDDFFDASIIDAYDPNNPTARPVIKVTGKGNLFSKKKFITNIVQEKSDNEIAIKSVDTFIAEKLNIHQDIATVYIENRPWRTTTEMNFVEDVVSEAQSSHEIYVDLRPEAFGGFNAESTLKESWSDIKKAIYPSSITEDSQYEVTLLRLDTPEDRLSPYELDAVQYTKKNINYVIAKILSPVIHALYYDAVGWEYVDSYLFKVSNSGNEFFVDNIAVSIRKRIKAMRHALSLDKIYLTMAREKKDKLEGNELLKSLLTPREIASGKVVHMPNIEENVLFINADKLLTNNGLADISGTTLVTQIIKETARIRGMTSSLFDVKLYNGLYIHFNDALQDFTDKLLSSSLPADKMQILKRISSDYLESVTAYKDSAARLLEQRKLAYLFDNDPGYRMHVILNSDDFLTAICSDLSYIVKANNKNTEVDVVDNWVRKYNEIRTPDIKRKIQTLRTGLVKEKIIDTLRFTKDFNVEECLKNAKTIPAIANAINNPLGKSEEISEAVANFLDRKGFHNIRFRPMAMFMSLHDNMPRIHFVMVGEINAKDYIFDFTAGQFSERYSELSGPIILPEDLWAQKYAALSPKLLIKYRDFTSLEQANEVFNQHSKYLTWGPEVNIPGATALTAPEWYFPEDFDSETPGFSGRKEAGRLGFTNPVREAARRAQFTTKSALSIWDYAVSLLENAELLSRGPAEELRQGIKQAAMFQRDATHSPGSIGGLFASQHPVDSMEKLLRVREGELLFFMAPDPNMPAKGPRPIHVVTSIGNGRFAGLKNSIINPSFGDGKKILIAEQLGEFKGGKFTLRGSSPHPDVELYAATAKDLLIRKGSTLRKLAAKVVRTISENEEIDLAGKTAELLRISGTLSAEQTVALHEILKPMFKNVEEAGSAGRSIQNLFNSAVKIDNRAALENLSKGEFVVFGQKDSTFAVSHVMYCLGRGEFMMVNPERLDRRLEVNSSLIKAEKFDDEIFKNRPVYAGDLSLTKLRLTSLLGPDSKFSVSGNTLIVRAHGAPSNVWYMNAAELEEVIKGLGMRENTYVDWSKIDTIELHSCFAGYGFLPTGKVLANLMQKKVKAWPRIFSARVRGSFENKARARNFIPTKNAAADVERMKAQDTRYHYMWSRMQWLAALDLRDRKRRDTDAFESMLWSTTDLLNGKTNTAQFYSALPLYKTQLYLPPETLNDLLRDGIYSVDEFAERCVDIMNISEYSAKLLDDYLSKETDI
ncbi:hypothetical protein ACQYRI_11550 [Salmonella enterica]